MAGVDDNELAVRPRLSQLLGCGKRSTVVELAVDQHRGNAVQTVGVPDDLSGFEPDPVVEVVGDDAGEPHAESSILVSGIRLRT